MDTLVNHYKDTLPSKNKWNSKRLIREKVFKPMNVFEEEFRQFEEFKLTARF